MIIFDEERPSDSPFVERIWCCHSERGGSFISIAESRWEMVVTRRHGKITLTVRGPETKATLLGDCPAEGEWLGIRFKPGTVLPHLPARKLVDATVTLPQATGTSFWLDGSAWQFPDYDNADTFVDWLVCEGLLVREPVVGAALQGQLKDLSLRSVQRRFLQVAGVTQSAARQIERARYATLLLQQAVSILDTTIEAGYFDQPHLTRSLKYFIGQTPAQPHFWLRRLSPLCGGRRHGPQDQEAGIVGAPVRRRRQSSSCPGGLQGAAHFPVAKGSARRHGRSS